MNRKHRIRQCLEQELQPLQLDVDDESHQHHVTENAETHFKIVAVSRQFSQQTRIARHRSINTLLEQELKTGLHALSLHLYTPQEWEKKMEQSPESPHCRGGFQRGENK